MAPHPHLSVPQSPDPVRFTSPSSGRRERPNLPARDRAQHAQNLIAQLEAVAEAAEARAEEQKAFGLDDGLGIYLTFQSEPNFELKFESLDLTRQRGLNSAPSRRVQMVDIRKPRSLSPKENLTLFLKRIVAYRDRMTKPREEGGTNTAQKSGSCREHRRHSARRA